MSQDELTRAWDLIRAGRAQDARALLVGVLARQPKLAEAHRLLGMALRVLGAAGEAETAFKSAISADKKNPAHLAEYAAFLEAEGRIKDAERQFRAALVLNRRFAPAATGLAHLLMDQGRPAEALQITTPLAAVAPGAGLRLLHASAQQEAGRLDEAEATLAGLISASPADVRAHTALAELRWMRTGDRALALEALDKTLAADPSALALRLVKAKVLTQTGEADAARAQINQALKAAPDDPGVKLAWAKLAGAEGLAYAEEALKTRPRDQDLLVLAVQAALAAGDAAKAEHYAWPLIGDAPLNQFYIALLGTAWRMAGDDRYAELYDYDKTVHVTQLATPKGWPTLSAYLADLAEGLHGMHALKAHPFGQSVRGGSQVTILSAKHPAVAAVQQALEPPIRQTLERIAASDHALADRNTGAWRYTGMWSIRLASSGYHDNHVHPAGWLSSACYVEVPPLEGEQGWLKFGEPGVKTLAPLPPEKLVEPKPGRLVLFPSYMWHGVVPFTAPKPRLNFAFDLVPA